MKFLVLLIVVIGGKSPGKAVLLSAVIPGGGQFYTGHYARGVIYFVSESYFGITSLLHLRNYYRKGKELSEFNKALSQGFWFLSIWGFSLVDAYVSAHLYKFEEVNKEIVLEWRREGLFISVKF